MLSRRGGKVLGGGEVKEEEEGKEGINREGGREGKIATVS